MGWFDEQIKQRIDSDTSIFEDSFIELTDAIIGTNRANKFYDERVLTKNAVEDILKYYHIKIKEIPDTITGVNDQLEWLLRPHGIMRRLVELSEDWYKEAVGPMLGFTQKDDKAVALIPGQLGGYYYKDPETGLKVKVSQKNQRLFARDAICFYTPFPMRKLGIKDIVLHMYKQLTFFDKFMIVLLTAVVTLIGMIMPELNKLLFSDVVESKSIQILMSMAVFMISVSISNTIFTTVKEIIMESIRTKIDLNIEAASMMRVLALPVDFFKMYGSGELSQRVSYINSLATMLMNTILSTCLSGVFSIAYIFQIFKFAPALVFPAIMISLVTVIFTIVSTLFQMGYTQQVMEKAAKESSLVYSIITGIQKIRLAGAEKRFFARWAKAYSEIAKLKYNPPVFLKINSVIATVISLCGTLIIYTVSIINKISLADYFAFNTSYGMMSSAFMQISGVALTMAEIKPILNLVKPIFEAEPEIAEGKEVIEKISGGIELSNISFRYNENMPNVIDNLSLKIRPGQYVAICGATGCGKSTLMRLILGFEKPQLGGIFFDGKNINNIDMKSLRRKIGCVMQNGSLFQGDIYSNIVISAPWLTLDDAWEAAEMAGMADDIRAMPMGMNTIIAEGQGGISGGQKQRLMIARAIAPKPKLLMFDEATSALDNITQKKVSESLDSLKCTRIVVAHRLSTIKQCDRIIVLEGGHIIEDGTYDELINNGGYFTELVERQRI